MGRLNKGDFVPYAPDGLGEQVHVDHEDCPAGTDNRQRLYIKRANDGRLLGYCHNCGNSGYHMDNDRSYRRYQTTTKGHEQDGQVVAYPSDTERDINRFPVEGRAWLYRYGITDEEVIKYGIAYSGNQGRVLLPVYDGTGDLCYIQGRSLDTKNNPPKYRNQRAVGKRGIAFYSGPRTANHVVIVEDILSAIVVGRNYPAMALLGTHADDELIGHICNNFENVTIFLDPDATTKALKLKRRLDPLLDGGASVVVHDVDPKECSEKTLTNLIGVL